MFKHTLIHEDYLELLLDMLEWHQDECDRLAKQIEPIRERDLMIIAYRDQAEQLHEIVKQAPALNKRTWDTILPPWRQRLREQSTLIIDTIRKHRAG